jgi:hypothetical protein
MQKKELIHLHTKTTAEEHGVEGRVVSEYLQNHFKF